MTLNKGRVALQEIISMAVEASAPLTSATRNTVTLDVPIEPLYLEADATRLTRRLRRMPELGHPVLVAVTGWGTPEDRLRSKEAGFDEHLTKPVDISTS